MLSKNLALGFVVILTGLASASGAWAGTTSSPEATVLQNIIVLQGENLPTAQKQTQLNQTLSTYFATAPEQGQQARLQQALVDLGVFSPAQASTFVANAGASASRIAASTATGEAQSEMISNEINQLARTSLAGAQFSINVNSCGFEVTSGLAVGAATGYITYLVEKYGDDAEYPGLAGVVMGVGIAAFAELIIYADGDCGTHN